MLIPIRLKIGHTIPQQTTQKWDRGDVVGFGRAADSRGYAIILTEHGEFEYVDLYGITYCKPSQGRKSAIDSVSTEGVKNDK